MADVMLTLTIPDAHVATATPLFKAVSGAIIRVEIDKRDPEDTNEIRTEHQMLITEQGDSEGDKAFGTRVALSLMKCVFHAMDRWNDEHDRYRPAIAAITSPASDVPDEIIQ